MGQGPAAEGGIAGPGGERSPLPRVRRHAAAEQGNDGNGVDHPKGEESEQNHIRGEATALRHLLQTVRNLLRQSSEVLATPHCSPRFSPLSDDRHRGRTQGKHAQAGLTQG